MNRYFFFFFSFLFAILLLPAPIFASELISLKEKLWKNRLIVFIDLNLEQKKRIEKALNNNQTELIDRHIEVGFFNRNKISFLSKGRVSKKVANHLIDRLNQKAGTPLIALVGKDGEIKFQGRYDTPLKKIFKQIDSMPMRKFEIRANSK